MTSMVYSPKIDLMSKYSCIFHRDHSFGGFLPHFYTSLATFVDFTFAFCHSPARLVCLVFRTTSFKQVIA